MLEGYDRKVPEKILRCLEDRDQCAVGLGKTVDHGIQAAEQFFVRRLTGTPRGGGLRVLGFNFCSVQCVACRNVIVKLRTITEVS